MINSPEWRAIAREAEKARRKAAGIGCPKCGGSIGSHSDLCGDCGFDPGATQWTVTLCIAMFILTVWAVLTRS